MADDEDDGPTEDEYWAIIRALGLRPTKYGIKEHPIYSTVDGNAMSIPNPKPFTPKQRQEILNRLKIRLGIMFPDGSSLN